MLDNIILGMVLTDNLTGYDIKKFIENGIGVFYKASFGSLYPALKKLSEKGYLIMYEEPQGSRQKKFYKLTEDGKKIFLEWLTSPMNIFDGTNTHLAKVYFFDKLPADIRDRQLLEHEINNTNYLRKLQALEKDFDKLENKDCFYYKLSTLYYGICITQETIKWCKHIREGKPLLELMHREDK
jgi:DNA-binding PadR family transcriptional regulator